MSSNGVFTKQKIKTILRSSDLQVFDNLKKSKEWKQFNQEEKELLSNLFSTRPKDPVFEGKDSAKKLTAFFKKWLREDSLASKWEFFWGCHLLERAIEKEGRHDLERAIEKFTKVSSNAETHDKEFLSNTSFRLGLAHYFLGCLNGEPDDFEKASLHFQKASSLGYDDIALWEYWGSSFENLSQLLNDLNFLKAACHCYNKVVKTDPHFLATLKKLSHFASLLFRLEGEELYFDIGREALTNWCEIESSTEENQNLLGRLYLEEWNRKKTKSSLVAARESLLKALEFTTGTEKVERYLAQATLHLGALESDFSLLKEAEKLIEKALADDPQDGELLALSGLALYEIGLYFEDEESLVKAIEHYRKALLSSREYFPAWYGLAKVKLALALIFDHADDLKRALHLFSRAESYAKDAKSEFWIDWAIALTELGQRTGEEKELLLALEKFEIAFSRCGSFNDPIILSRWLTSHAEAYLALGLLRGEDLSYQKALDLLKEAIAMAPHDFSIYYHLGVATFELSLVDIDIIGAKEAVNQFKMYLDHFPDEAQAHIDLALYAGEFARLIYDPNGMHEIAPFLQIAEWHLKKASQLGAGEALYLLAALYAWEKQFNAAMFYIELAEIREQLPPTEELEHDDWLEYLRKTPEYKLFISGRDHYRSL